ncbi:uncharacterized protein K452DRAFT_249073 [Aplosporella prunicola CBS 121167]|uniref:Amino acid transporter transmembrane domain-containing protein n=1 Tax=Aplosporella prunicola CBS 121167 TaxID=1176127 RepID=A0A6A6BDZ1_9PEZI|nr:uncharacterized protein K452DRAFT_249073 [Aplosporella prunicola CBS 121167]KAF2142392.1 hypothetical protein K452DRAFT_249073 [Aplosporella prunicola CBS 121167]
MPGILNLQRNRSNRRSDATAESAKKDDPEVTLEPRRTESSTAESAAHELNRRDRRPEHLEKDVENQRDDAQNANVNPFGEEDANAEVHYRTMEWWHAGALMLAETISLGVLSLPAAMATLGLFPGIFLIITLGMMSTYTGYVIGQFYQAYPSTHSYADAGMLIGGRVLKEILGVGQCLILIFLMAAHVLSFSIAMNYLTDHATCSVVFGFLGFIVCLLLGLKRQLQNVAYLSVTSCLSVIIAVTVAMVGIAVIKPDAGRVIAINHGSSLHNGTVATLQIIIAYAGHVAFFVFSAELKKPADFPKALLFMQGVATTFYVLVAVLIYYYAGPNVLAPALGSASPAVAKAAFALALPTIIIAGIINGHVAAKYLWVRLWRDVWKRPAALHTRRGWPLATWLALCTALWLLAWVVAEAVPEFQILLGLISALFASWFSYGLPGALWLYLHRGRWWKGVGWRRRALAVLNALVLLQGAAICGFGLFASGVKLGEMGGRPFSCKDNYRP